MAERNQDRGPVTMTFQQAGAHGLTFGKYKFKTLDDVAKSDEGLMYLDWLLGKMTFDCKATQAPTLEALTVYLADESIAKEVKDAVRRRKHGGARCGTWAQSQNAQANGLL